jgi:hypothetical protein
VTRRRKAEEEAMTLNRKKKEMVRTYAVTLGEWVKERTSTARDRNAVAFLAVRDDVKEALGAGFPLKTIWTHMYAHGNVPFGYDTFRNYVNRYIVRPEGDGAREPSPAENSQEMPAPIKGKSAGQASGPKVKKSDVIPGFIFNASPKKEDLI